jgi:agmatine/peptidylarginine deiminase
MTDKVFVENKTKSRIEIERILHEKLQSDILFLPWDIEEYYGHSDGIVHYAGDGRVIVSSFYYDFFPDFANEIERKLKKRFEVIPFHFKTRRKHKYNWAYVNFLQTEKLIMVPQLGYEDEDGQAIEQIKIVFPDCEVIGIPALEAVRKGGALNCLSWNIKGV